MIFHVLKIQNCASHLFIRSIHPLFYMHTLYIIHNSSYTSAETKVKDYKGVTAY